MSASDATPNAGRERASVRVLGVQIDRIGYEQMLDQIGRWVQEKGTRPARQICTVNPEFLVDAQTDPAFRRVLDDADLRVADGTGVVLAARLLQHPVPERVTGSDGIYRIAERAAREGWRLYLLGAAPGVAERAAVELRALYAGLIIVGCFAGRPANEDWRAIELRLRQVQPDILLVAFGHPRQDFWIWAHRADLPCAVALGVGGAFDFVAGVTTRAPLWMRRAGLEWLHRLVSQPWRWRRMLKLPRFVYLVTRQLLDTKAQRPQR